MSELYDSVDCDNLNFEYVGPTKNIGFYECMDSKELFNEMKNNQIRFGEIMNKQKDFLKKLNKVKIGKKAAKQKKVIDNLNKFYNSREEVINFLRDYIEMISDAGFKAKQDRGRLKILTPKQMLQR